MSKQYVAVIGLYDENTTEQVVLKETSVNGKDVYEAHKTALFKCNLAENQMVLRVLDYNTKAVLFDFLKGFNP